MSLVALEYRVLRHLCPGAASAHHRLSKTLFGGSYVAKVVTGDGLDMAGHLFTIEICEDRRKTPYIMKKTRIYLS